MEELVPLVGNGVCDNETNTKEFNYDGGDCCLYDNKDYCNLAGFCATGYHPNVSNSVCNDEWNNEACGYDGLDCCPFSDYVGDEYCDDIANTPECWYDGGDCCLSQLETLFCSSCTCLNNSVIISPGFPKNSYDQGLDMFWLIKVPKGFYIKIRFISFDLLYSTSSTKSKCL